MKRSKSSDLKGKPGRKKICEEGLEALKVRESKEEISFKSSALSNQLILHEIFGNLAYLDLANCAQVNETWKSVADRLICHYGIVITDHRALTIDVEEIIGGIVRKRSYNRMNWLLDLLRNSKRRESMSIKLQVNSTGEAFRPDLNEYVLFLKEFGDRVYLFYCKHERYMGWDFDMWMLHLSHFPNLQVLTVGTERLHFGRSTNKVWKFVLDKAFVLRNLRELRWKYVLDVKFWRMVLEHAPNVRNLERVPLERGLIETLSCLNRIDAISSFSLWAVKPTGHATKEVLDFVLSIPDNLKKLADLGVKLTSARIPSNRDLMECLNPKKRPIKALRIMKKVKEQFLRVLKSSQDTLNVLKIPREGDEDESDRYFPTEFQMKSVKSLQFEAGSFSSEKPTGSRYFFPEGMNLKDIFPTIDGIAINFLCNVEKTFPRDTFGPESLLVRNLRIRGGLLKQSIRELFPFVTRLEIQSDLDNLNREVPRVFRSWPSLKHLAVFMKITPTSESICLDPALTGIPEYICKKLLMQGEEALKVYAEEIAKFQGENTSLLSMKDLETLEFIVSAKISGLKSHKVGRVRLNLCFETSVNKQLALKRLPSFITSVTTNLALKRLPKLAVCIRTYQHEDRFTDLKDAFAPLENFIQVEGDYVPSEIPFL